MPKSILIKLFLILTVLLIGVATNTQAQTPTNDTVTASRMMSDATECEKNLRLVNQRLEKVLDALEQAEKVVEILQAEILNRQKLAKLNEDLIVKKDEIISNQTKLIGEYERRKGLTVSFLFGLVKIRKN